MPRDGLPRVKTDLKLAARIHQRYRDHGDAAGLTYAVQVVRQMPEMAAKLYALMPQSRAQSIRHAIQAQQAAKDARQSAAQAVREADEQRAQAAEQTRREALVEGLQAARQQGTTVTYLAGLPPADRDRLGTVAARREAIALRKTAMLKGKVLAALGCTATELERWHADGRLPHLFTRVLTLEVAGKAQACRFWAEAVVMAAVSQVEGWREHDRVRRRARPAVTGAA